MKIRLSEVKQLKCPVCEKLFTRRVPVNDSSRRYCSTSCKKEDSDFYKWGNDRKLEYSERMKGEGNSNYARKWTEEQKELASIRTIENYEKNPEYRILAGNANRGVKFSPDRIKRMTENREYIGHPHSDATKKKIGAKSKEKWTPEYLETHRNRMESLGYWIPPECKSSFELYYEEANWIGNMISHFGEQDLKNLKEYGMMNVNTNTRGYVRDHIFCRVWGYVKGIPACMLRHPVNMAFISTRENIQKGFIDRSSSDEVIEKKLADLICKIINYKGNWIEHHDCLKAIEALENRDET